MAKKMYFHLRPECFMFYDRISSDPYYNRLVFVAKQKKLRGRINIKEQITGTKFVLKIIPKDDKISIIKVYSNKLELRTNGEILLHEAVLPQQMASGFYCSFKPGNVKDAKEKEKRENECANLKEEYISNVLDFFKEAKVCARNYKNDIYMQDKQMQRNLRQLARRLR